MRNILFRTHVFVKPTQLPAVAIWFALLLTSCGYKCPEQRCKALMGDMYLKKISFPASVELLNRKDADSADWYHIGIKDPAYYIVHFFMADCDKCVHELEQIRAFIEKHRDTRNVRYLFIASGPTNVYARDAVRNIGFDLPVYYEREYFSFKKMNDLPLADRLYNTMLINERGELLLVGEIFQNRQAEQLFFNTINGCL